MGATILVVEDEEPIMNLVVAYLRNEGFSVLAASDGDVALALARKDFRLITAAAGETGTAMPLAELVLERLNQCVQLGRAGYDFAGLTSVIREESGLPERR